MQIEFSNEALTEAQVDALIVGRVQDEPLPEALHARLGEAASELLADVTGKASDEVAVFYPRGEIAARRLLVVGLGKGDALTLEGLRRAAAKGIARAKALGARSVATSLNSVTGAGFGATEAAQAVAEAASLTLYRYSLKQKQDDEEKQIETLRLLGADEAAQGAARRGAAIASGVAQARDLVNAPPNIADAPYLAQVARDIAASNPLIEATILSLDEARELGMGAFVGVGQGSAVPPQFIILRYRMDELKEQQPVGLVGKGLIFDTGGISIKPGADMWKMKSDMAGGAAVLGAFRALANLPEPLPLPVVGVVPATDNAVGHLSFTPADVLRSLRGKSIEIQNTDAEGRLILADALTYVERFNPRAVVDLATLTGAMVIALGHNVTGMFANDDELAARLSEAGEATGEALWRMPLVEEYEKLIESEIADVKNVGGRGAGAITAALFLRHFIGDYAWAHLDIAGTALAGDRNPKLPYNPSGASGVGVRLLLSLLDGYASAS